jgi:acyl-CoA thioesterase FadM
MSPEDPAGSPAARPASVVVRREVEWRDTDAAGHYHHSAVIHWVESAEGVLQQRLGLGGLYGTVPRVRYEVDYLDRLWFRDVIDVEVAVADVGRTSVAYAFEVRRGGTTVARGRMVTVHADPGSAGTIPWTEEERRLLSEGGRQHAAARDV